MRSKSSKSPQNQGRTQGRHLVYQQALAACARPQRAWSFTSGGMSRPSARVTAPFALTRCSNGPRPRRLLQRRLRSSIRSTRATGQSSLGCCGSDRTNRPSRRIWCAIQRRASRCKWMTPAAMARTPGPACSDHRHRWPPPQPRACSIPLPPHPLPARARCRLSFPRLSTLFVAIFTFTRALPPHHTSLPRLHPPTTPRSSSLPTDPAPPPSHHTSLPRLALPPHLAPPPSHHIPLTLPPTTSRSRSAHNTTSI